MTRELLFSVQSGDLVFSSFTVSGAGGQGRDHVNTGVRYFHPASGASGESREHREQLRNKRAALVKLTKDPKFTYWVSQEIRKIDGIKSAEQWVEDEMQIQEHFKTEYKDRNGRWVEA